MFRASPQKSSKPRLSMELAKALIRTLVVFSESRSDRLSVNSAELTSSSRCSCPREERDAAQILSDAFARDGIEVRLNTRVVGVRVEGGEKHLDLISEDYRSTVTVGQILAGTGPRAERRGSGP